MSPTCSSSKIRRASLRPEVSLRSGHHSEAWPITLENQLTNIANHIPHHIKFIDEKRTVLQLLSLVTT
jgi:hypothetical protein